MTIPAAQLWFGRTTHVRTRPFQRSFAYRIAMLEIDVDQLDAADRLCTLFAVARSNLISFRAADYGARDPAVSLRTWVEARFGEAGIVIENCTVRLLTFPRMLGYGFAPISLWQAFGPDGSLRGVIYEVHNTYGETHAYVSAPDPSAGRQHAEKAFFVSPFLEVSGGYRFTLRRSDAAFRLIIENTSAEGVHHVATLSLTSRPLTSTQVLKCMGAMPISGLGVIIAIHWQALRLWLKGARYRGKPGQRAERTTLAQ